MTIDPKQAAKATSSDADDAGLLARVAAGDRRAFDTLYRRYWPRLTRFLGQIMRRPELMDEVLDDTMLVVWRKAGSFNAQSRVSTWIFAIAYKKALKALKSRSGHLAAESLETVLADEPGPEHQLMRVQLREMLGRALATLSAKQRAVVELTYFHGYAYAEVAQVLGCPVDTVKTRMFHARRKLRLLIEAQTEEG